MEPFKPYLVQTSRYWRTALHVGRTSRRALPPANALPPEFTRREAAEPWSAWQHFRGCSCLQRKALMLSSLLSPLEDIGKLIQPSMNIK